VVASQFQLLLQILLHNDLKQAKNQYLACNHAGQGAGELALL